MFPFIDTAPRASPPVLVLALCVGLPAMGGIIALVVVLTLRKKDEEPDE